MFGDSFFKRSAPIVGSRVLDRLMVFANDLDSPNPLPAGTLSITEPGPVGIFESSLGSVQEIQQLLRGGQPLLGASFVGQIADNATLTTASTVPAIILTPSNVTVVFLHGRLDTSRCDP